MSPPQAASSAAPEIPSFPWCMKELRAWWHLTFLLLPLHSSKTMLNNSAQKLFSCSNCLTFKGWQENLFLFYLFVQDNLFPFTHMQAHKLYLGGFTAPDLWQRFSAREPNALPLCRKSIPASITAFLLLLLIFFPHDMQHLLPSEKCPFKSICTFTLGKKHPPFLLFLPCHN